MIDVAVFVGAFCSISSVIIIAKMVKHIYNARSSLAANEFSSRARNAVKMAKRFGETESLGIGKALIFAIHNDSVSEQGNGTSVSIGIQISNR